MPYCKDNPYSAFHPLLDFPPGFPMITSAENRAWPDDVAITELAETGLPVPSLIRVAKIATIEARDAEPLGRIAASLRPKVRQHLGRQFGF